MGGGMGAGVDMTTGGGTGIGGGGAGMAGADGGGKGDASAAGVEDGVLERTVIPVMLAMLARCAPAGLTMGAASTRAGATP